MIRHDQVAGVCDILASRCHEAAERLAPAFGCATVAEIPMPWGKVPETSRRLVSAVAGEVVGPFVTMLDQLVTMIEHDLGPTPPSDLPLVQTARAARDLLQGLGL